MYSAQGITRLPVGHRAVVDGPALGAAIATLRESQCPLAVTAAEIPEPRIEPEALSYIQRTAIAAATLPLTARSRRGGRLPRPSSQPRPDCSPGPISADRRSQFRRVVPRNVASERQRDEARTDPCRVGWGSLLLCQAFASRLLEQHGETLWRAHLAHSTDAPPGPAERAFRPSPLPRQGLSAGLAIHKKPQKAARLAVARKLLASLLLLGENP